MHKIPSEGTFIRAVYDVLYNNRGKPVDIFTEVRKIIGDMTLDRTRWSNAIIVLNRDYSCEIEMIKARVYILKAQYIGRDWVMYDGEEA